MVPGQTIPAHSTSERFPVPPVRTARPNMQAIISPMVNGQAFPILSTAVPVPAPAVIPGLKRKITIFPTMIGNHTMNINTAVRCPVTADTAGMNMKIILMTQKPE